MFVIDFFVFFGKFDILEKQLKFSLKKISDISKSQIDII